MLVDAIGVPLTLYDVVNLMLKLKCIFEFICVKKEISVLRPFG